MYQRRVTEVPRACEARRVQIDNLGCADSQASARRAQQRKFALPSAHRFVQS
jgi:hypothetical protein